MKTLTVLLAALCIAAATVYAAPSAKDDCEAATKAFPAMIVKLREQTDGLGSILCFVCEELFKLANQYALCETAQLKQILDGYCDVIPIKDIQSACLNLVNNVLAYVESGAEENPVGECDIFLDGECTTRKNLQKFILPRKA